MMTSLHSFARMLAWILCWCVVSGDAFAATKKGTSKPKSSAETAKSSKGSSTAAPPAEKKPPVKKPQPAPKEDEDAGEKKAAEPKEPAPASAPAKEHAPSASLEPSDLLEFEAQPPRVQQLIAEALALTKLNLTYTYGSADPAQGGMDCSGTIYHTLRAQGVAEVPRDSSQQYVWVRKAGGFQAVVGTGADTFELDALRPGDLMFWSGTYSVEREFPVTHVMLYLGREKKTKKRVMFGASDGRSYNGIQRWGVSVFDFKMPKAGSGSESRVDFLGYGPIPGLRTKGAEVMAVEPPKPAAKPEEPDPPAATETKKTSTAAAAKTPSKPSAKGSGSTTKKRKK